MMLMVMLSNIDDDYDDDDDTTKGITTKPMMIARHQLDAQREVDKRGPRHLVMMLTAWS